LALAAVFFAAGGCMKGGVANVDSRGKTIICFGDSVTFGCGAGGPGKDYPAQLGKMTSFPVINSGINDETSGQAVKRLQNDVLDKDPIIVIVEFGGNDFLNMQPVPQTMANIEEIIKRIQKRGAMVALADISSEFVMSEYTPGFRQLSQKYGTILIPGLLADIMTEPTLKSDFIHPNAKGYRIVAQRIYRAIIPYLNQNAMLRKGKGVVKR
jgi:lysophospholipase L1-like esterase